MTLNLLTLVFRFNSIESNLILADKLYGDQWQVVAVFANLNFALLNYAETSFGIPFNRIIVANGHNMYTWAIIIERRIHILSFQ